MALKDDMQVMNRVSEQWAKDRKQRRYQDFRDDMEGAGYAVEEYQGRYQYRGPAVMVESRELQDVIRATTVRVQWDHMGKDGLVIYPQ